MNASSGGEERRWTYVRSRCDTVGDVGSRLRGVAGDAAAGEDRGERVTTRPPWGCSYTTPPPAGATAAAVMAAATGASGPRARARARAARRAGGPSRICRVAAAPARKGPPREGGGWGAGRLGHGSPWWQRRHLAGNTHMAAGRPRTLPPPPPPPHHRLLLAQKRSRAHHAVAHPPPACRPRVGHLLWHHRLAAAVASFLYPPPRAAASVATGAPPIVVRRAGSYLRGASPLSPTPLLTGYTAKRWCGLARTPPPQSLGQDGPAGRRHSRGGLPTHTDSAQHRAAAAHAGAVPPGEKWGVGVSPAARRCIGKGLGPGRVE